MHPRYHDFILTSKLQSDKQTDLQPSNTDSNGRQQGMARYINKKNMYGKGIKNIHACHDRMSTPHVKQRTRIILTYIIR